MHAIISMPYFILVSAALLHGTAGMPFDCNFKNGNQARRIELAFASTLRYVRERWKVSSHFQEAVSKSTTLFGDVAVGSRDFEGTVLQTPIADSHRQHNACTDPVVRKEWRTMSSAQKRSWIRAVNCLARLPGSGKLIPTGYPSDNPLTVFPPVNKSASWYDDFSYAHLDLNTQVHQTGLFFPWHRYYLWSFEQSLKEHCGYTGFSPYWDWTKDYQDFANSSMWDPDPEIGLGGFGDSAHGNAIHDGGFAGLPLVYPTPHTLMRQYTPYPFLNLSPPLFTEHYAPAASSFSKQEVQKLVSGFRGDFKGFQTYFEGPQGMHMSVHFIVGGDLSGICPNLPFSKCTVDATPNDPIFWLHHGMVDKVWFDWQHAHGQNYRAFEAGTVRDLKTWPKYPTGGPPAMTPDYRLPTDGILLGNYTVADMFNTTSNAPLCYTYE